MTDTKYNAWLLTVTIGGQKTEQIKTCKHSLDAQLEQYKGIDEIKTTVKGIS